jgi:hypothetical protein
VLEVAALREVGMTTHLGPAQALAERGVLTPRGSRTWTHTTITRLLRQGTGQPAP